MSARGPVTVVHRSDVVLQPAVDRPPRGDAEERRGQGFTCQLHERYKHLQEPRKVDGPHGLGADNTAAVRRIISTTIAGLRGPGVTDRLKELLPEPAKTLKARGDVVVDDGEEAAAEEAPPPDTLFTAAVRPTEGNAHVGNGFHTLREFIRESEHRIQSVKSKSPGLVFGLDAATVPPTEYLKPDRGLYPVEALRRRQPLTARAVLQTTGERMTERNPTTTTRRPPPPAAPHDTARRHCPGRPGAPLEYRRTAFYSASAGRMKALPVKLPSLQTFVDQSAAGMLEQVENGPSSARPADKDSKDTKERRLRHLQRKLAEREEENWAAVVAAKAEQGLVPNRGVFDGKERCATTVEARKKNDEHDRGADRAPAVDEPAMDTMYHRIMGLMNETDPSLAPTSRLRDAIKAYQATRKEQACQLRDALYNMDADRLQALHRRSKFLHPTQHGPRSRARTGVQLMRTKADSELLQRHTKIAGKTGWYKEMLQAIYDHRRDLPDVCFFIFDFVQQVLEYGMDFDRHMFCAMLEDIDNAELEKSKETHDTPVVARLILTMVEGNPQKGIEGIEGVTFKDVVKWFETTRGAVPTGIADSNSRMLHSDLNDEPATVDIKSSVFVTDMAFDPKKQGKGAGP
mmetsp:Transcript_11064/g.23812  ORF Transcript_11064/g.23812 Transcript_11064/m.23812 type:complete len:630 (-) Transcript_11064:253-2142(-)